MLKLANTFQKIPHRFPHNLRYGYITAFRLLHMVFYLLIEGWRYYYAIVNFLTHYHLLKTHFLIHRIEDVFTDSFVNEGYINIESQ